MSIVDAPSAFTRRNLFVCIDGEEKTGKTHLALTIAQPNFTTLVHDLNDGLDGVVQKRVRAVGDGKIKIAHHPIPDGQTVDKQREKAKSEWSGFAQDFRDGMSKHRANVIDSGTELYKLSRMSEFGDVKQTERGKGQLDYDAVYSKIRGLMRLFHASKSHLIITHQVTEEWKNRKDPVTGVTRGYTTGRLIFDGFKEIPYMMQIGLRTKKVIDASGLHFVATLEVCRFDPKLEGTEFSDEADMFDLPTIMGFVTETDREVWLR